MYPCISIWSFGVVKTTDLAVIFRPAVLSHPDHEMQPQEHRLSQEVLEFLIAHQDWFMLDIPPPPTTSAGLVGSDEEGDMVLTSDEEANGGGWKLVGDTQPSRIGRRRTTTEKHSSTSLHLSHRKFCNRVIDPLLNPVVHGTLTEGIPSDDLSPVSEAPGSPVQSVGGSIRRSRTLPNRRETLDSRSGEGEVHPETSTTLGQSSPTAEEPHRARVLRKQKRSSMQAQRNSQI